MTTREGPSNLFLPLAPSRTRVPNGAFDVDIGGWSAGTDLDPDTPAAWALLATYGSTGSGTAPNFDTPAQVARDSSGRIWVADTANNRAVRLTAAGAHDTAITGLTGIKGICVDGSDNVYVIYTSNLSKYNAALALQWNVPVTATITHLTTDSTNLYVVAPASTDKVAKVLCSDGSGVTSWGTAGSGNGQLSSPYGILYYNSEVYVVDAGNSRVEVFNPTGTYQRQWAIPASARGIGVDDLGNILVACFGSDEVRRYTTTGTLVDSFSQADPDGVVGAPGEVAWVSNATTDNIAKWDHHDIIPGSLTVVRSWDGTVGGEQNGSYKFAFTVNGSDVGATAETLSDKRFPVNNRESIEVAAWCITSTANIAPRLRLVFLDDDEVVISTGTETSWTPAGSTEYRRTFAARVPDRATQYRIGIVAYAITAGATGNVWFDDITVNDVELIVADVAMGQLTVAVKTQGRWLA